MALTLEVGLEDVLAFLPQYGKVQQELPGSTLPLGGSPLELLSSSLPLGGSRVELLSGKVKT